VVPVSDGEDPMLAWWHYGLGKSMVFTSDIGVRWTTQWPNWSGFPEFWEGCVRWAMRGTTPPNMMITSRVEGERGIIDLEAVDEEASFMNFMRSKVVVIDPSGNSKTISLQQTGPGRYHAEFDAVETGAWLVNILFQDANGELTGMIPTAVTVPYAREYAATTHNASLLHELATRTDGRVLSFDDMELINLFDKTELELPQSPQSVWDLLAIIAVSFLLLDIAIRRLWFDKKRMQSMFTPVEQIASSSVEALRKVHVAQDRSPEFKITDQEPTLKQPKVPPKVQKDVVEDEELKKRDDNLSQLLKSKRAREDSKDDQ